MLTGLSHERHFDKWLHEFDHERATLLKDFKVKVVNTSAAEEKEREKNGGSSDIIEQIRDGLSYESRVMLKSMTLD